MCLFIISLFSRVIFVAINYRKSAFNRANMATVSLFMVKDSKQNNLYYFKMLAFARTEP